MTGPGDAESPLLAGAFGPFPHRGESWHQWLAALPRLVSAVLSDWDLEPDGYRSTGQCALVLGVRTSDGEPAAVKFGWPHQEADHEHLVLRAWAGDGAVRLLRADPVRSVLLLERTSSQDLTTLDIRAACETVAALYPRLHRPAIPQLRPLSGECTRWAAELAALPAGAPAPHRLVQQASALAADFASDPATDGRIVHGDLHYFNVLAAERAPWLAIDPKPLSGDPCFEVAPLLWNRWPEAVAGGRVRDAVRERMDVVVDAAQLDRERVRDWIVVRQLVNVLWALQDAPEPGPDDLEWITRSVTIAKAVQG